MIQRYLRYAAGWIAVHGLMLPVILIDALHGLGRGIVKLGQVICDLADFAAYDRKWSNKLFDIADPIETWAKRD